MCRLEYIAVGARYLNRCNTNESGSGSDWRVANVICIVRKEK